jgi:hypothetical protein
MLSAMTTLRADAARSAGLDVTSARSAPQAPPRKHE